MTVLYFSYKPRDNLSLVFSSTTETMQRKWWLADGLPVKSTIQAPPGHVLNSHRQPNPFGETSEPDWVKVDMHANPKPLSRASTFAAPPSSSSHNRPQVRKLPPPYNPSGLPSLPPRHTTSSVPARKPVPQKHHSPSSSINTVSSTSSSPATAAASKPKPPIPQKPSELARNRRSLDGYGGNGLNSSFKEVPTQSRELFPPPLVASRELFPPPPLKKSATMGLHSTSIPPPPPTRKPVPALAPTLPPRSEDLMDGSASSGLEKWEPLRPSGNV